MKSPRKQRRDAVVFEKHWQFLRCFRKGLPTSSGMSHDFLLTIPVSAAQTWSSCLACSPSLARLCRQRSCISTILSFLHVFFKRNLYFYKCSAFQQKHQPGSQRGHPWTVKGKQSPCWLLNCVCSHHPHTRTHARAHTCVQYSSNLAAKYSTSPPQ